MLPLPKRLKNSIKSTECFKRLIKTKDCSEASVERSTMENHKNIDLQAWIDSCEADFETRLNELATQVLANKNIRLFRLSGPTCSGKTTLANLLKKRFLSLGKHLHLISIDDFFYDKSVLHKRAELEKAEELDYDSAETIDWDELSRFVREIFSEQESHCPIFSFQEGKRVGYRTVASREEDVFLFEGIQAFYPEFTEILKRESHDSVGLYIMPMRSIEVHGKEILPNELRLLRRLVRDYNFRNSPPEHTLALWASVRRNEESNIFPYASEAEYWIDSTMPYELGVLKPYLERILPTVSKDSPYWNTVEKILCQMKDVCPIPSSMISEDSLYQEFI